MQENKEIKMCIMYKKRNTEFSTHSRSREINSCYCNEYSFGASNNNNKKHTHAINRHYRSDTQIYECKLKNKI